jgi:hypothetical protein
MCKRAFLTQSGDMSGIVLQNAKVSVMGSGQLSQVMTTVSKCGTFFFFQTPPEQRLQGSFSARGSQGHY